MIRAGIVVKDFSTRTAEPILKCVLKSKLQRIHIPTPYQSSNYINDNWKLAAHSESWKQGYFQNSDHEYGEKVKAVKKRMKKDE
jgi:hypothetical protein